MLGVIVNALAVVLGGILGAVLGSRLKKDFTLQLNQVFGICAIGMGIKSIVLMENMPAVILAVVLGTTIGLAVRLGDRIRGAGQLMERGITRVLGEAAQPKGVEPDAYLALLVTAIVLFCSSGTGIYGSLDAGMTGNVSVLLAKSVLDLFTAMVFACSLGAVVCVIALPQLCIFTVLFLLAKVIFPLTTPMMVNDFKAAGGFLLVATGCRIAKMEDFPIADMIPAMVLAMPISWLWTNLVAPLL